MHKFICFFLLLLITQILVNNYSGIIKSWQKYFFSPNKKAFNSSTNKFAFFYFLELILSGLESQFYFETI